jgi:hypothetical protein
MTPTFRRNILPSSIRLKGFVPSFRWSDCGEDVIRLYRRISQNVVHQNQGNGRGDKSRSGPIESMKGEVWVSTARRNQFPVKLDPVISALKMPATCQPTAIHDIHARTWYIAVSQILEVTYSHVLQLIHRNSGQTSHSAAMYCKNARRHFVSSDCT